MSNVNTALLGHRSLDTHFDLRKALGNYVSYFALTYFFLSFLTKLLICKETSMLMQENRSKVTQDISVLLSIKKFHLRHHQ